MKKLYTTSIYKQRNTKRSLDAVKKFRKRKKRGYSGKSNQKSSQNIDTQRKNYNHPLYTPQQEHPVITLKAPNEFSLIYNTEETIQYFNNAQDELKKGNRVLFDISQIQKLSTDAIAVLIAKIKDERFIHHSSISGNEPSDVALKELFIQSGFYDYVRIRGPKPINNKKLLIHKITNNRVEPDIAKEACLLGLRHTFNNEDIFEPLYNILIEIMQNTNNHAGSTRGKYDWWLHVYTHPNSTKTSYTFLDLGVGIFESLPVKSYKRDFLEIIGLTSNLDLVPKLFAGEIKSRTSRPERGKGIPQVYECSKDSVFNKFILISNDIFADLKNAENKILHTPFNGTMYYWEIINN